MQQLFDLISGSGGQAALGPVAARVGLTPEQTQAAMKALLPALAGGMRKQAQANPATLERTLAGSGAHEIVDRPHEIAGSAGVERGNAVLGGLFGSKDVSRQVAQHASTQTGIAPDKLKLLLPILATLAAGAMAKQGGGQAGGLGGLLGGLAGGRTSGGTAGGLAGMLDIDGDGNPLDDIMGMAGKILGSRR
jgi:hypothetical protein